MAHYTYLKRRITTADRYGPGGSVVRDKKEIEASSVMFTNHHVVFYRLQWGINRILLAELATDVEELREVIDEDAERPQDKIGTEKRSLL
jgi:hypothetical protein